MEKHSEEITSINEDHKTELAQLNANWITKVQAILKIVQALSQERAKLKDAVLKAFETYHLGHRSLVEGSHAKFEELQARLNHQKDEIARLTTERNDVKQKLNA